MIQNLSICHVHSFHCMGGIIRILMFFKKVFFTLASVLYLFSLSDLSIFYSTYSFEWNLFLIFLLKSSCCCRSVGNLLNFMCLFCIMLAYYLYQLLLFLNFLVFSRKQKSSLYINNAVFIFSNILILTFFIYFHIG